MFEMMSCLSEIVAHYILAGHWSLQKETVRISIFSNPDHAACLFEVVSKYLWTLFIHSVLWAHRYL